MADGVLDFSRQFGEGAVVAFGDEERVVAKTAVAVFGFGYCATHDTFDLLGLAAADQGDHCAEASVAVGLSGEFA